VTRIQQVRLPVAGNNLPGGRRPFSSSSLKLPASFFGDAAGIVTWRLHQQINLF
jgi:hypothetical protein